MARAVGAQGFFPAPLPVVDADRRAPRAIEGALGDTPLPSLLLQLATRAATGTLVFRGDFGERRMYFVDGVAARVAPGVGVPSAQSIVARLDADATSEVILDAVAHAQIVAALQELSSFAPETTFDFRMATDAVTGADVPARPKACDLLESILVATRCARDEARLEEGLLRVVGKRVALRGGVDVERFAPNADERRVLDVIARDQPTYETLCAHGGATTGVGVVRRVVHALLYTRHLDLGVSAPPLGGDRRVRDAIVARRDAIVSVASANESSSNEELVALVADPSALDPSTLPALLEPLKSAAEKAFLRVSEARRALAAAREIGVQRAFDAMEHHRLAEVAAREGNFRAAEAEATLALEMDATAPEYEATLDWIRAMQSDGEMLAAAIAKTTALLEASTPSDGLLVRRAALLRRAGREAEALGDYRMALELNPSNVDATRALAPRRRPDAPNALARIPTPPPMMRTAHEAPKTRSRRAWWIVAAIALVAAGAAFGLSQVRTPQAKAREEIVAWGIAEEVRDENATTTTQEMTLDAEADTEMRAVVALLDVDERLDDGKGSHSDATVQQAANRYLLHRAAHRNLSAPVEAISLARDVDHHATIAASRWSALVAVWNHWLDAPTAAPPAGAP